MARFGVRWLVWLFALLLLLVLVALWTISIVERQKRITELYSSLRPGGYDTLWKAINEPWDVKELRIGDTTFKQTSVGERGRKILPNGAATYVTSLSYRASEWALTMNVLPEGPDCTTWHVIGVLVYRPHDTDNAVEGIGTSQRTRIRLTNWLVLGASTSADAARLLPRPRRVARMSGDDVWWEYELKDDKHWIEIKLEFDAGGLLKGVFMHRGWLPGGRGQGYTFAK